MWIAFEGHDGSGKTSTADMLCDKLRELGKDVLFLRLPGSTPFGSYTRNTWHSNEKVRFLQVLANHVEVIEDLIIPHLARGGWVVQDRTCVSSIVYSGWAGPLSVDFVAATCKLWITKKPDVMFVLECPSYLAVERLGRLEKDLSDPDEGLITTIQIGYKIEGRVCDAKFIDTAKDQITVLNECMSHLGVV